MSDVERWRDPAMFRAAPMAENARDDRGNITPKVTLLWATPEPLAAIAAMCRMYEGKPTYRLGDITVEERQHYFDETFKTHLKAPLEAVKMHFFIEGVTRSFTHQMVRQRTAVYAQESLRFAVKENIAEEVALPPSVAHERDDSPKRVIWDKAVTQIDESYRQLVSAGIPAEDARGLLPHSITTRLNYITDLRSLADHAGNRLCTQAQFEWRKVFTEIVTALGRYNPDPAAYPDLAEKDRGSWEWEAVAGSALFRPACYHQGKCPFKADFDRGCTIRGRVDQNAAVGRSSDEWHMPYKYGANEGDIKIIEAINPAEWLLDPEAGIEQ